MPLEQRGGSESTVTIGATRSGYQTLNLPFGGEHFTVMTMFHAPRQEVPMCRLWDWKKDDYEI